MRRYTAIAVLVLMFLFGFGVGVLVHKPAPRLIGIDCFGASGPIYANEEDHFPACTSIEKN
jgi:hypothetical protein